MSSEGGPIPKRFHFIWLGDTPLPKAHRAFVMSWRRFHPGWELVLWQDREHQYGNLFDAARPVEELDMRNRETFHLAGSMATKANVLRLEVVFRFGGVYVDTDFLCHRPIDSLIAPHECFAAEQDDHLINNAIFGAAACHEAIGRMVDLIPDALRDEGDYPAMTTGPNLFTVALRGDRGVAVFDRMKFYPLAWAGHYWGSDAESYATHLWAFSWSDEVTHDRRTQG